MSYTQATESTMQASSQPTRLSSPQSNNLPQPTGVKQGDLVVVQFGSYTTPAYTWFKGLRIPILPGEVAKALGKTIDVRYIVNGLDQSPGLQLYVQPIEDGDAALLPTPTFKELEGDVLDATKTATLHVDPWPLMAIGQKVWCVVHGTDTNNQATSITLWTSDAVIASELINGCNKVLPSAWLKTLEDGSNIQIEFLVTFDQSTVRANAVVFPVKPYRVKSLAEFVLDPTEMKLDVGKTGTRTPTGGQPPYRYISNVPSVASVNQNGTVTAVSPGTATITVSDSASPQNTKSYVVTVAEVEPFFIEPADMILDVGSVATRIGRGGRAPYFYESDRQTIARVADNGVVTGVSAGTALITARDSASGKGSYHAVVLGKDPVNGYESFGADEIVLMPGIPHRTKYGLTILVVTDDPSYGRNYISKSTDQRGLNVMGISVIRVTFPGWIRNYYVGPRRTHSSSHRMVMKDEVGRTIGEGFLPNTGDNNAPEWPYNAPTGSRILSVEIHSARQPSGKNGFRIHHWSWGSGSNPPN